MHAHVHDKTNWLNQGALIQNQSETHLLPTGIHLRALSTPRNPVKTLLLPDFRHNEAFETQLLLFLPFFFFLFSRPFAGCQLQLEICDEPPGRSRWEETFWKQLQKVRSTNFASRELIAVRSYSRTDRICTDVYIYIRHMCAYVLRVLRDGGRSLFARSLHLESSLSWHRLLL